MLPTAHKTEIASDGEQVEYTKKVDVVFDKAGLDREEVHVLYFELKSALQLYRATGDINLLLTSENQSAREAGRAFLEDPISWKRTMRAKIEALAEVLNKKTFKGKDKKHGRLGL